MDSSREVNYRLRLAKGFIKEAAALYHQHQWRACVSSSQLAVENSAKAVLSIFRPIAKIHELSEILINLVGELNLKGKECRDMERLAECAKILGLKEHITADYGDELAHKTPWEIYNKDRAKKALDLALEAYKLSSRLSKILRIKKKIY